MGFIVFEAGSLFCQHQLHAIIRDFPFKFLSVMSSHWEGILILQHNRRASYGCKYLVPAALGKPQMIICRQLPRGSVGYLACFLPSLKGSFPGRKQLVGLFSLQMNTMMDCWCWALQTLVKHGKLWHEEKERNLGLQPDTNALKVSCREIPLSTWPIN